MSETKKDEKIEETKKTEVQNVEEDDEFEEFPLQDWQAKENAEDDEVSVPCVLLSVDVHSSSHSFHVYSKLKSCFFCYCEEFRSS